MESIIADTGIEQYADSKVDFVDASVITIAKRMGIQIVLTIDQRDFRMVISSCREGPSYSFCRIFYPQGLQSIFSVRILWVFNLTWY